MWFRICFHKYDSDGCFSVLTSYNKHFNQIKQVVPLFAKTRKKAANIASQLNGRYTVKEGS